MDVALLFRTGTVRYTLDGSEVRAQSPVYTAPLTIESGTSLRCAVFEGERKGEETTCLLKPAELSRACNQTRLVQGLEYAYYEGEWTSVPDFAALNPLRTGTVDSFHIEMERRKNYFGLLFRGYIKVPHDGVYSFYVMSDDGAFLIIDGKKVVDNDGQHGMKEAWGQIGLAAGLHTIELPYFDYWYDNGLEVSWYHESSGRHAVTADMLYRKARA